MARPRKSASRVSLAVSRARRTSRPNVRTRHGGAGRPVSRARAKTGHKGRPSTSPQRPQANPQYQTAIKNFETGVRAFHKQNYHKAAEIFAKLVDNEARDVAERAHLHLRLCRQRTGRAAPLPKSADDYYTLGVACLNARDYSLAVEHLSKADKMKPHQDHIHYALAVSHALGGNAGDALAHLEASFALRPENRIHARRDEDFQGLAADPRFRRLIYPAGS
jgi:tetratricopeptide (TPR) repeat protein